MSGNPKVPDRLNNGLNISLGILCKREGVQIQLTYILYLYGKQKKSSYSTKQTSIYPNVCLLFLPGRMSKSYPYSGEIIRRAFTFMWNTCLQAKMSALHV